MLQAFCCNSTIEPFYLACRSNLNCTTAIAIIATTAKCYVLCHGAHVYSIGPTSMHKLKVIIHHTIISMYINGHTKELIHWRYYSHSKEDYVVVTILVASMNS